MRFSHPRRAHALLAVAAALALLVASVGAADASHVVRPQLLSPKPGAVLARGSHPTFTVKDLGHPFRGAVWIAVSTTTQHDRHGRLTKLWPGTFSAMTAGKHHRWTYVPESHVAEQWFMNRPGKYYWQVNHTNCDVVGCVVVSRVRSFVVR